TAEVGRNFLVAGSEVGRMNERGTDRRAIERDPYHSDWGTGLGAGGAVLTGAFCRSCSRTRETPGTPVPQGCAFVRAGREACAADRMWSRRDPSSLCLSLAVGRRGRQTRLAMPAPAPTNATTEVVDMTEARIGGSVKSHQRPDGTT